MDELDRRSFLTRAAASGLVLAAGADLAEPAVAALRSACRPGPPIPRTIQQAIRGHVFDRSTPGFRGAARVFNTVFDGVLPKWVARPINTADVRAAVRWAIRHDVAMRARSGGHSYAGYSTLKDGLVIDLRRLDGISVNRRTGIATIGAGAQLIDVYSALASHGATIPAGSCSSVGVGGSTLGGGMGLAGRAFGLTCDSLVGAEIVTADGCVREVSRTSDPDLFWALRGGGGGNFGIVTHLKFRVHPMPRQATWLFMSWPWSQASAALDAWQSWQPRATDRLPRCSTWRRSRAGRGSPSPASTTAHPGTSRGLLRVAPRDSRRPAQLRRAGVLRDADAVGGLLRTCRSTPATPSASSPAARSRATRSAPGRTTSTGRCRAPAAPPLLRAIENRVSQPGSGAALLDSYGGAINRVHPNATAFVHRGALFCIQYITYNWGSAWLAQTRGAMRPYVSGFCYQNYIDATLRNWQHAYYGSNYRRLQAIRRRVDPQHRFNFPQAIGR